MIKIEISGAVLHVAPDCSPDRAAALIEPEQKVCPCGCTDMVKIGEDRSERPDHSSPLSGHRHSPPQIRLPPL